MTVDDAFQMAVDKDTAYFKEAVRRTITHVSQYSRDSNQSQIQNGSAIHSTVVMHMHKYVELFLAARNKLNLTH